MVYFPGFALNVILMLSYIRGPNVINFMAGEIADL